MFQDYMRSRLGLNGSGIESPHFAQPNQNPGVIPNPIQPAGNPSGVPINSGFGAVTGSAVTPPPGFNPMPYHPAVNPTGWPGHPMNPTNVETPGMQHAATSPTLGGQNTVNPTGSRFNPYTY
jgi:hypothetical protein